MKNKEKNNFTKLTQKKGISLITLVITIIVIIILAAAIVMSLNNNNIITNASTARYEQDRDYIQSALELAIQKVVLRHKGGIELGVGAINETVKDVKLVDGKITWTSKELAGLTGEIIFDEGEDTSTKFYVGEKLPVYGSQTTWYVDEQGRVVLQIANKIFGAEEVPSVKITASQIMENPSEYFGKTVKYETEKGKNYEWQIFHADEGGIYLITKDYIKREDIPNSCKNGAVTENKPNDGYDRFGIRTAYFTNILSDYENGSADVKESMRSLNKSYFIDKEYTSSNGNMQSVAYMLDKDAWSQFADDKATWVIGGPSLELLCKSYNAYKGSEILACEATSLTGYKISNNGGNLSTCTCVFNTLEPNGMYRIIATDSAQGYWIASPSANDSNDVMFVYNDGYVDSNEYDYELLGFRPLVYLKSGIRLEVLEDDTFLVK